MPDAKGLRTMRARAARLLKRDAAAAPLAIRTA
jgi:hypothetical protein